jgi:hypothetical protein
LADSSRRLSEIRKTALRHILRILHADLYSRFAGTNDYSRRGIAAVLRVPGESWSDLLSLRFASPPSGSSVPSFKFAKEQRVYVVAVESNSRELASARASLELERMAKDEFRKAKLFRVATSCER